MSQHRELDDRTIITPDSTTRGCKVSRSRPVYRSADAQVGTAVIAPRTTAQCGGQESTYEAEAMAPTVEDEDTGEDDNRNDAYYDAGVDGDNENHGRDDDGNGGGTDDDNNEDDGDDDDGRYDDEDGCGDYGNHSNKDDLAAGGHSYQHEAEASKRRLMTVM